MTGVDFSAGWPGGAAIAAAGHDFVVCYVGTPGRPKSITPLHFRDLLSHDVSVVMLCENRAGDALGGYDGGRQLGREARADATYCGWPGNRPIYCAVDFDVTAAQMERVMQFVRGFGDSVGGPDLTGVYGEYDVITEARRRGLTRYEMQTAAWSRGRRDPAAEIFQRVGVAYVGTVAVDIDEAHADDFGQYPLPTHLTIVSEDYPMQIIDLPPGTHAHKIIALQPLVTWQITMAPGDTPFTLEHVYNWTHTPDKGSGGDWHDTVVPHEGQTFTIPAGTQKCDLYYSSSSPASICVSQKPANAK